jgi:hypothetical protein
MEEEAADADKEQHDEGGDPHLIVAILNAASNAFDGKVDEEEVGERVDNLCNIVSRIVVLIVN